MATGEYERLVEKARYGPALNEPTKYQGVKNPALTDDEFEALTVITRTLSIRHLQESRFLGYWGCPKCGARHDMVHPEHGDLVIECDCGAPVVVFPLPSSSAQVIGDGAVFEAHPVHPEKEDEATR